MTMENGMQVTKAALDKHNIMKQEYLEEFQLKYTQLVRLVNTMPLHHNMRMNGFTRADEFYFWIREAINNIQFVQEVPAPEAPPETSATPEEPTEKVAEPQPLE